MRKINKPKASRLKHIRRRGAQPGNTNAWRHGKDATVHPSRLAALNKEIDLLSVKSRFGHSPRRNMLCGRRLIVKLLSFSATKDDPADFPSRLMSELLLSRCVGTIVRSSSTIEFKRGELSRAFHWAPDMIYLYFFRLYGVDIPALQECQRKYPALSSTSSIPSGIGVSFQKTVQKIGKKAGDLAVFQLTDDQWSMIDHIFPIDQISGPPRRGPSWSPRQVLDTIFWKTSEGLDWESLPGYLPSIRTCRGRMTSWSKDARLPLVYLLLYKDLIRRTRAKWGDSVFDDLTQYFFIDSFTCRIRINEIHVPGTPRLESWQLNTTRLFLQFSHKIIRRFKREGLDPRFKS